MPLSLRFVVPLALALAAIAYAVVPVVDVKGGRVVVDPPPGLLDGDAGEGPDERT